MPLHRVGILLFEDVELLDFAGPLEVFSVTLTEKKEKAFEVFTMALQDQPIRTVNGLTVTPNYSLKICPKADILVLPGGNGSKKASAQQELLAYLRKLHEQSAVTLSVCSGIRFLAKLGLIDGLKVTTHHEVLAELASLAPEAQIQADERYTDNGKIKTAGGISAGIDLALAVVGQWMGRKIQEDTQIYMEYGKWRELQ